MSGYLARALDARLGADDATRGRTEADDRLFQGATRRLSSSERPGAATGLRQSAFDITAASVIRTQWSLTVQRFFERYDYFIVPTAQVFPFPVEQHWPKAIGTTTMRSYHEWMKGTLLVTMSGGTALAVPAGFNDSGLPIGIQLVAPNRRELDCLKLAYAYEAAISPAVTRAPNLLASE